MSEQYLNIPYHIDPIALISVGYTDYYPEKPLLELHQWEKRQSLEKLIFEDQVGKGGQVILKDRKNGLKEKRPSLR